MDTSVFFGSDGVFDSAQGIILKQFNGRYREDYIVFRTRQIEVSNKNEKLLSDYKTILWELVLDRESDVLYIAITDRRDLFIGYATIGNLDGDIPSIGLEIKEGYRHKGNGKKTVELMLRKAEAILGKRRFLVEIYSDNKASHALFSRYNLEEISRKESEYIQAINELNALSGGTVDFSIADKDRYNKEKQRKIIQYHLNITK